MDPLLHYVTQRYTYTITFPENSTHEVIRELIYLLQSFPGITSLDLLREKSKSSKTFQNIREELFSELAVDWKKTRAEFQHHHR